ncbi:MAG: HPF/RaiA family ribosome-associated protein [bacterium]|nr:cold shock domain-containing protein [Myxococcales bacterium]MCB9542707.1 cold shock domain-containing protein [Myxococcales bacterium]MCB9552841.1 cold shock domain-containing protein [Myxococcales bacterium]
MQVPLHIYYGHLSDTEKRDIEPMVRAELAHIERVADEIIACDVAVERPNENLSSGSPWRVRVRVLFPPQQEYVARHEAGHGDAHEPLDSIIRGTFDALRRQLEKAVARQRDEVKHHEVPIAFVVRLFEEAGYGFIRTPAGEELYFHRNAVLHHDFDRLTVGTEVRYSESMGDEGPQASSVQIIDKPGNRPKDDQEADGVIPAGWRRTG